MSARSAAPSPSRQGDGPRTSERTYLLAISFSHALIHAMELTYAALLLRIEAEFGTNLFLLGILANVGAFAFGLGALPSGFLVDRLGSIRVLRLTLSGAALAAVVVGVSSSELMLGAALAFLGITTGLYHPAGVALLARTARRSRNMGLHGAIGNLGIAGAPLLAAAVAVSVDWRAAYFLLAVLAALAFLVSLRLDPRGPTPATPTRPLPQQAALSASGSPQPSVRWGRLAIVYSLFVISGLVYRGALTFIPSHIEEQISFSMFGWDAAAVAGSLATLALLGGAVGWYAGGLAAERFPREPLVLGLSLVVAPALLLIGVTSEAGLLLAVALFVIVNFATLPVFTTLVADYAPPGRLGSSYGMSFFLSFGMGSFSATLAGFFADRWGTDSVFLMLAVIAGLGVVLAGALTVLARRQAVATTPTTV